MGEQQDGASLLSSLHPRLETSHANSVTACVSLHPTVMGVWGAGASASAAPTRSQTSSVNRTVLLPAQTLRSWR